MSNVKWQAGRRLRASAVVAVAAVGMTAGCSESPSAPTPLETLPRALTAAEQEVISASNQFAFGLLREVAAGEEGNVFLSPLSASMALGMTMNGAAGETYSQMRDALGFEGLELAEINQSYRGLIDLLLGLDGSVDTRIANSIWYRNEFPFDQPFFDTADEYFSAEVTGLPFVPSDRETINDWVDRATGGKIPEIVDEVRPDHVMFLINAIYFKGSWTNRFDRDATRNEPFHLANGTTRTVPMMKRQGSYATAMSNDLFAVDLPYGNGAFSMTIVLPTGTGRTLDEVVATLDPEQWKALTAALHPREMHLSMPRFRLEYRQELNEALRALGMEDAFVPYAADFTGMSAAAGRDLYIDKVLQKTYVDVNEEGTEAAASTSVEVVLVSMPGEIRIDRPFLFAIRERFSGTILFIGKIADPS
jgi:serine protease inhibitor